MQALVGETIQGELAPVLVFQGPVTLAACNRLPPGAQLICRLAPIFRKLIKTGEGWGLMT